MVVKKAIEVKVLVNGRAAEEYSDDEENDGPKTVTRYIEALSGANFEVHYELKPFFHFPSRQLQFDLSIDGKLLDSGIFPKERFDGGPLSRKCYFEGIRRSYGETWSVEKFRFSDIKISDDQTPNANADSKVEAVEIGTISLGVQRVNKGVYHKPGTTGSRWDWDELIELGTLPEKALKGQALSHCTSLQSPQFIPPLGGWEGLEYVDSRDTPYVVFNFKYRSRKVLQDLHIIPRTPTPVALEERPIEELNIDEARELLRRQRERQGSIVTPPKAEVKAEVKPERGIKREYADDAEYTALLHSARAKKVPRTFEDGEVIDLSED